tara:strand:- start:3507 stop:3695 length:189 start_codon:yes stop_codon:yes gene_type:complete
MENSSPNSILDLGPTIDELKALSDKFKETGDFHYMTEILLIIEEIEMPLLIDTFDGEFTAEA